MAAQSYVPVEARQGIRIVAGYVARGLDDSFLHDTTYSFAARAQGYSPDHEVWAALCHPPEPGRGRRLLGATPQQLGFGCGIRLPDFAVSTSRTRRSSRFRRDPRHAVRSDGPRKGHRGPGGQCAVRDDRHLDYMRTLAAFGPAAVTPTVWYLRVRDGVDPVEEANASRPPSSTTGCSLRRRARRCTTRCRPHVPVPDPGIPGARAGDRGGGARGHRARAVVERRQQIGVLRSASKRGSCSCASSSRRSSSRSPRWLSAPCWGSGLLQRHPGLRGTTRVGQLDPSSSVDRDGRHPRRRPAVIRRDDMAYQHQGVPPIRPKRCATSESSRS